MARGAAQFTIVHPARTLLIALVLVAAASPAFAQRARTRQTPPSTLFPLDHFWSLALESPLAAEPAADDRRVYVPLSTGQLVAYEPGRDEHVWSVELAADAAPLAADGKLFVHAAGLLHALDPATGAVRWRLPAGSLAAPLVYRGGWVLVALADGAFQAVRAEDGVVIWARTMSAPLASAPSVDGNAVAAAFTDGRLAVIDITTGESQWERSLRSRPGGVTVSGDRIFVSTDDGYFWSIKTRDGDLDWRYPIGSRMVGAAAADADRVYAVALDNVVRGFSRGSGHEQWRYPLPTRALAGPLAIDGFIVITSAAVGAPGLTYINAKTGLAAGKTPALEPVPEETSRVQFPVALSAVPAPPAVNAAPPAVNAPPPALNAPRFAALVTSTTGGDWTLHAYRQTFLSALVSAAPAWIRRGRLYEVRFRLDIWKGPIVWGERMTLQPPPVSAASPAGKSGKPGMARRP